MTQRVSEVSQEDEIAKCGEYYLLAQKLDNLFQTILDSPILLLNYLETEDKKLLDTSCALMPRSPKPRYLLPWAKLLQSNQVPLDQVCVLFYSIICGLEFPFLSAGDQLVLQKAQKDAAELNLDAAAYGSPALEKGFKKLTTFFASEFKKYFTQ